MAGNRLWERFLCCQSVAATSIARDNGDLWLAGEPGLRSRRFAIRYGTIICDLERRETNRAAPALCADAAVRVSTRHWSWGSMTGHGGATSGLGPLMVEKGRARGAEEASELGPGIRLAHVDDANPFDSGPRRLDPVVSAADRFWPRRSRHASGAWFCAPHKSRSVDPLANVRTPVGPTGAAQQLFRSVSPNLRPPKPNSVEPPRYGSVCQVVWEGPCREASPIPINPCLKEYIKRRPGVAHATSYC